MNMPRNNGQSTIELTVLITMAVIALTALSRYVQFALAGRVKSGADGVSQFLYDPARTTTTWTTTQQLRDTVDATGFLRSNVVAPVTVNRAETTR